MKKSVQEHMDMQMSDILFEEILENEHVITYYQPIVDLKSGEILGYEALARGPRHTQYYSPLALIEKARELGRIWDLELLFRKRALEGIKNLEKDKLLFVNVDPEVIKSPEYEKGLTKALLFRHNISERNIVFEITERTAIYDYKAFMAVLNNYKNQDYQIAIDDVGAGYSGLVTINEVRPNYVKIDMDLIRNIDKDAFKQALIKVFVDTSLTTNIKVIAEGIETKEELKTLIMLGVHAGQGFYLKKPASQFEALNAGVIKRIKNYNQISKNLNDYAQDYHYISNLVNTSENLMFESMTPSLTVKSHMDKSSVKSACICERERPVGLVMKYKIDASLSGQFGFSLYSSHPISRIMNTSPLIVDFYLPINTVSKSAMERSDDELFDDIIVTKGGRYYGTVPMKKIFEYTLMYEKTSAKDRNPLTDLPGNPVINRVLIDAVNHNSYACIMYIDINEFKIYNDVYGFEKGDEMIVYLANMLTDIIKTKYPYTGFLGHVGGDDFIAIIEEEQEKCVDVMVQILDSFEQNKASFFKASHLEKGTITAEDRFGVVRELPLTSISVSGIYGELNYFNRTEALTEALANVKRQVKKSGKSDYLLKDVASFFPRQDIHIS